MSTILPGIALINNFDNNGELMRGALLRIYQAGTVIPVTAYKDSGLTAGQEQPWPIQADSAARLPMFYLPEGDYRIRLSSSDGGYVAYDIPLISGVGPSTGGGGGGGGVSDQVLFRTGYVLWMPRSGILDGFVRYNGRTIGNSASGATERANADVQALFEDHYNIYNDTICPVIGGRGASATADFNAGKQLTLLNGRFIIPIGLDDMGNTSAGRATGVPVVSGSATAAASVLGEALHKLTPDELAVHKHVNSLHDPGHHHNDVNDMNLSGDGAAGGSQISVYYPGTKQTEDAMTGITITNADAGGDASHNNTPLVMTGTYYVKL